MAEFVGWDSREIENAIMKINVGKLEDVGQVIAEKARAKCPVGKISRPMYKTGRYAGQSWTARDAGALKKSIRVVQKEGENDVWVIAGSKEVSYAGIVEHYTPFMRPALRASRRKIKTILGVE